MDLSTITVEDFKTQFSRGFPYLNTYDPNQIYYFGNVTYYQTNFFTCNQDGTVAVAPGPNVSQWTVTQGNVNDWVLDSDITNAFAEAQINFNQGLFNSDAAITLGYLYLTAHYLVNDLRAAGSGLSASGSLPVTARSVGSVSESYGIPDKYLSKPEYAFYITSPYGMKYLQMILPYLKGNVVAVHGSSGVPPWVIGTLP